MPSKNRAISVSVSYYIPTYYLIYEIIKESHSKSCFILACRRFYFLKYLYICRKDDLTVNQFLFERKVGGKKIGAKIVVLGD